jgi:hypothetical protein
MLRRKALKAVVSGMIAAGCMLFDAPVGCVDVCCAAIASKRHQSSL